MPSPVSSPTGLLCSQIGYDASGPKRALYRCPEGRVTAGARFVLSQERRTVREGALVRWGVCWGSEWWVADLSDVTATGDHEISVCVGATVLGRETVTVGSDVLWNATWRHVSYEQAERRQRLANQNLGWYDAGTHWQEANSHAMYILGLAELLERKSSLLTPDESARLLRQIENGCDYLVLLAELAPKYGFADGCLVHQSFKHDRVIVPGDMPKAAAAWARAARLTQNAEKARVYRKRAVKALRWMDPAENRLLLPHAKEAYEAPIAPKLDTPATPYLLMMLAAELDLAPDASMPPENAVRLARALIERQVPEGRFADGYHGMYGLFTADGVTTKAWTHGWPAGFAFTAEAGQTVGIALFPFLTLLRRFPQHPDAPAWKESLRKFAYGYFAPACEANPFLLCPNGHYGAAGLLWFAGLWHGCTTVYGLAAALAREFAVLFGDDRFERIAVGNLQWIAGLNAGLTRQTLAGCHMYSTEVPEGVAVPVSLINGIGRRSAGTWLNIRGAICNGFGTGDQFTWDVPPLRENDTPSALHDEDWITHAGAWLTALAAR